jgi:hypothetical protein
MASRCTAPRPVYARPADASDHDSDGERLQYAKCNGDADSAPGQQSKMARHRRGYRGCQQGDPNGGRQTPFQANNSLHAASLCSASVSAPNQAPDTARC